MYAVIQTGGKQYRVKPGDIIDVELLPGVSDDDTNVVFDRVLMVGNDDDIQVGAPVLDGASVSGEFLAAVRGPKIIVFKMKRRKQYRRKRGHRQNFHRVRIQEINQ